MNELPRAGTTNSGMLLGFFVTFVWVFPGGVPVMLEISCVAAIKVCAES